MDKINVTRSSMPTLEEYVEVIKPIWENRWLTNRGAASLELEEGLKKYLECENIWLFSNGHSALEIAIQSLNFDGGEVITTPYSFISTTNAIVRNGLTPVFVDVKEDNLTIDPELIEKKITEQTVAIVTTHVYGFLCDVDALDLIAKKHNLRVIYDGAHAFGVKKNGISAANFGDATMFSAHATKVFHTIEGGFLAYKDPELFQAVQYLSNFGLIGQDDAIYIGTNAKMNEFEAAMGICNLRHVDDEIARRKIVAERMFERLEGIPGIKVLQPAKNEKWNYIYFPVIFDGYKENRDEIKAKLERENIFARKYFYPTINKFSCYKDKYGSEKFPVANHAADCVLTLPMYADLTLEDADRICSVILR